MDQRGHDWLNVMEILHQRAKCRLIMNHLSASDHLNRWRPGEDLIGKEPEAVPVGTGTSKSSTG